MMFVTDATVRKLITPEAMRNAIADAFRTLDRVEADIFPFVSGRGADPGDRVGVKFGRDAALGYIGVKAGSYFVSNKTRGLPAHASTVLLLNHETAEPVAVVAASYLNGLRTAAANALATDALSRANARVLTIFGTGAQAFHEVRAISEVRALERVVVVERTAGSASRLVDRITQELNLETGVASPEAAVRQADILVTVTSSRTPIVQREWVRPGTHISAMGADGPGKQELDIELVASADVFVDYPAQAKTLGECQHAYAAGRLSDHRLDRFTLGAILNQHVRARLSTDAVTLFDSSGIAVQDIAAAALAMRLAVDKGMAIHIE